MRPLRLVLRVSLRLPFVAGRDRRMNSTTIDLAASCKGTSSQHLDKANAGLTYI